MNGKLLRWIGLAALVGIAGLAAAALVLVPPRVQVVVNSGEPERGPDRLATVEADVAALREDLRALAGGLDRGLGGLGDSLDELATQSEARAKDAHDGTARVEALQHELAALRGEVRDALAAGAERAATSEAPQEVVVAVEPAVEPIVAPPSEPALQTEPPRATKTRGFLSFKLPSDGFAFDQRTRFAVVPSLSRVGFDAKSTLHDFSGVTSRVDGELVVRLARPAEGASGRIKVESASLDTGIAERDANLRTSLDAPRFPELAFEWTAFEPKTVDAAAQKVVGTARGKLTLHGVTKEFAMEVTATVDASKRLALQGQAPLALSDFAIEAPTKLGVIAVDDHLTIWIALVARPLGLVEDAEVSGAR
ncbi:MAG: YceI family protein [Planctomycetes bacterium]|nr:YceI family protein [Planctomycetota bacterium]